MPTIPSVFRSIRKNDVQHRPFKAYKNYVVTNTSYSGSNYRLHEALHKKSTPNVGDGSYNYPTNFDDGSNLHVVWNSIDHKYYRYPFDPAKCHELTDENVTKKFLFYSASILSAPYFEVGERIKPGTLTIKSNIKDVTDVTDYNTQLVDDSNGNLRDPLINTSSFASASNLQFYMTFNNEFRKFENNYGTIISSSIDYEIRRTNQISDGRDITIDHGVPVRVVGTTTKPSGLGATFKSSSYIRVPQNAIFDQLGRCDHWTLSFFMNAGTPASDDEDISLFSKGSVTKKTLYNPGTELMTVQDVITTRGAGRSLSGSYKTPLEVFYHMITGSTETNYSMHFRSSNGTQQLHISGSFVTGSTWKHVAIRNSASKCEIFFDAAQTGTTGSIPSGIVSNDADLMIGAMDPDNFTGTSTTASKSTQLAEIRLYDYALNDVAITSLANRHFLSGSLYQTNTAGNVFYRNGQMLVSSPMPKYNNTFVSSSLDITGHFTGSYKGQHTIYENEILVRVPKGTCNVSVNPSAVFRPATGYDNTCNDAEQGAELYNRPGNFRKTIFLSGSARPYVTSIGLYNDRAQLLAVAKLAEPIQKRDDIDMNFIVRWDY